MNANTALAHVTQSVRPLLEVADIFRTYGEHYRKNHWISADQRKAMVNIENCRTAALGGHVDICDNGCGYTRISYNSCRDRHCPKCQSLQSAKWLDGRLKRMLPCPYFHVVVTFPHQLNPIILQNRSVVYPLLFKAAASSLVELCRDWKRFKAQIGFTAILHTWNQDLLFHPHLHLVVTAGGLDRTQERWIQSKGKFLVPVGALANKVRGKLLHLLKQAGNEGKLALHASIENLQDPMEFAGFISRLYDTRWHIYIKKPFAGPEQVFRYLSQYTHRVAISNQRLLSMNNQRVTFRARDNNNPGKTRTVSVAPEEFIRRLLIHILPKRFVKIRHYGLMAPCNVTTKLETARSLIERLLPNTAEAPCSAETAGTETTWLDRYFHITGKDLTRCPKCRKGRLNRVPLYIFEPKPQASSPQPIFLDSS